MKASITVVPAETLAKAREVAFKVFYDFFEGEDWVFVREEAEPSSWQLGHERPKSWRVEFEAEETTVLALRAEEGFATERES